jgi:hypothetical protein
VNAAADTPFEIGIRSRVPVADYRALPGVSITRLKELRRSPLHYRYALAHPKETTALRLGTAAHVAVLEPERFSSQFAIWARRSEKTGNLCPKNGQWWESFQGENVGRDIITIDEAEYAMAIQRAVRADPDAMKYLEQGDPEVTLQWTLRGRQSKGRLDWLTMIDGRPYLVGLKSARDCREYIFGYQAWKLGYHLQWAYYFDGYEFITDVQPGMKEIVVENTPPHAVAVYNIPDDIIQQGRDEYLVLHDQLLDCERAGEWPGPVRGETNLTFPTRAYETNEDLSDIGLEA